jgi:hypothetical protein
LRINDANFTFLIWETRLTYALLIIRLRGGSISPPMVAVKTGTEENPAVSSKTAFRVYPNPTTGSFTIELTGNTLPEAADNEIYGIRGNRVMKTNLSGAARQVISMEGQPTGLYFIRLMSDGTSATGKIIKN